ncbi:MAG: hypothetical protein N0C84_05660 [Candidatus Thiodiazotropha taylori]|uniref:Uncharacterized protein n=1 Tax=Candidatus Thiodiazotropha taylori TaxID=2792791 RepID=A0A9E4N2L7_9GAMM|nr:hypothetical protein [Candidatus Thiodiazotropha taylori]MCW4255939.1 hypothetical protein [Candidatus Thiodiazotropha taylori]
MAEKKLVEIAEQNAIFDGKPDFMPMGAVISLLNYNAYGGTRADLREAIEYEEMDNPKRYRVQLHLYIEELDE